MDDELAAIGSANLDNRSLRLNFEVMLVTVDRPFASSVERMLSADFAQAQRLTPTTPASVLSSAYGCA